MSVTEALKLCTIIMGELEGAAADIRKRSADIHGVMSAFRDAGLIKPLEATAMTKELTALTKKFEADLFTYHAKAALRINELNVSTRREIGKAATVISDDSLSPTTSPGRPPNKRG